MTTTSVPVAFEKMTHRTPRPLYWRFALWFGCAGIALTLIAFGVAIFGPESGEHMAPNAEAWLCLAMPTASLLDTLGISPIIEGSSRSWAIAVGLVVTFAVNFGLAAIVGGLFGGVTTLVSTGIARLDSARHRA